MITSGAELLDYRRQFALAIARPRAKALRIDRDNYGAGGFEIDQAVTSGSAYAVRVARDPLAADGDQLEHVEHVRQLASAVKCVARAPVMSERTK